MGAGRKTFTYDADTRVEPFPLASFENAQRNLGDELGGCIFGCTHETYEECVNGLVFGLPRPHWCYVQYIKKGMPIFLFNYNSRQLHGIFRAVSDGDWKINPYGWVGHTNRETQYPAQVRVEVYSKCPPLEQADYYQIIKNCYYPEGSGHRNKMMFELKKVEAQNLCRAFDRAAGVVTANSRPQPVPRSAAPAGVPGPSSAAAAAPRPAAAAAATAAPRAAAPKAAAAAAAPKPAVAAKTTEIGTAVGGWEIMAGAKKPKSNAWGAGADQAAENGEASTSKAAAAKEPVAPPTPPATPKASASDHIHKDENNGNDVNSKSSSSGTQPAAAPGPSSKPASSHPPSDRSTVAGASSDIDSKLSAVHAAVSAVDTAAADALWHCLSSMTNQMQSCMRDNAMLLQGMRTLKVENSILKSEIASVRRDTSRVGAVVNVEISAESPALSTLPHTFMGQRIQDIYMLGGHNGGAWLDSMHLYTPAYRSIADIGKMPFARGYGGAAVIGRSIYIVGGGDGASWLQTAVRYDIDTKEWFQISDMELVRGSLAVAALDGRIYAMGGGQPGVNHDSTEVFSPDVNTWATGPKMAAPRFTTAGATLGSAIYITGGFDGAQYLNSVEMLDPRVGRWQPVAPMAHKRGSHVCTVVDNDLFVIGGWDAKDYLAGVEIFDVRAGGWRAAAPMAAPRAYGAAATVDGNVFTLGGMQSQVHNETVERYDAANNKWEMETVPVPDAVKRAFLSACVLDAY